MTITPQPLAVHFLEFFIQRGSWLYVLKPYILRPYHFQIFPFIQILESQPKLRYSVEKFYNTKAPKGLSIWHKHANTYKFSV